MASFWGHPELHIYSRYRNPPSQGEKYKIKYPLGQNSMQSTRADKENDEVKICLAFRTNPIIRQILEGSPWFNATLPVAFFRVIYITAWTLVLNHILLLFFAPKLSW
jgi:hypothetical protein